MERLKGSIMVDYRKAQTDLAECLSVCILQDLGINAQRNNLTNITNVDILVDNQVKIDVQYSNNFALYGDLRVDFVSAYSKEGQQGKSFYSNQHIPKSFECKFKEFESNNGFKINKVGKYFQPDYLDAVIILFYDGTLNLKQNPDKIMIIKNDELLNYLNKNIEQCFKNLKINSKKNLGDTHGSAFLPINAKVLKSNTECFFDTIDNLKKVKSEIKAYLTNFN